jgi:FtsZ-interacting cell division protein ZipA
MQDIAAELRWILLASGVALILALAIFGRRRRHASSNHSAPRAISPARTQSLDVVSRSNIAPPRRTEEITQPTVIIMSDDEDHSPLLGDIAHLNLGSEREPSFDGLSASAAVQSLQLDKNVSDVGVITDPSPTRDYESMKAVQSVPDEVLIEKVSERQFSASSSYEDDDDKTSNFSPDESTATIDSKLATSHTTKSSHEAKTIDLDTEQQAQRSSTRGVARRIISLRLSFDKKHVAGSLLRQCLHYEHMVYGKYNIFHRLDDAGLTMFSVASMVEPGVFDLTTMNDTIYPGMTFFMQLPGAHDATSTYDEMLGCARNLEEALDGVLRDERGIALSPLYAERLREEIIDFQHISGAASIATTARNLHT